MILGDLARALLRRWYLVLVGLIVTAVLCLLVSTRVEPTYEATASTMLVPGPSSIVDGGNAFLYLGNLALARDVLVRTLGSDDVRAPILEANPGTDFSVTSDPTTSGPMILVQATGSTSAATADVIDRVLAELPLQLSRLQEEVGTPAPAQMTMISLAAPTEPEGVNTATVRAVGAVAAVGLVGTVLVTGLVDGLIRARAQRQPRREDLTGDDEPSTDAPARELVTHDADGPDGRGTLSRTGRERREDDLDPAAMSASHWRANSPD